MVASVADVDITEDDLGALYIVETLPVDESLRQTLFALIAREVFVQAIDVEFGAEVDQAEVDSVYADLVADIEAAGVTPAEALGVDNAGTEMIRFNAELGVIRQQVIDEQIKSPETIAAFYSDPLAYTTVCVRHVLVETEDEATTVLDRLASGEDFASVATEVSLDTGTPGGDLGCSLAGRYVPEFAQASLDAELGELFGPVGTDFGFHVLVVDDRSAPTEAELTADPQAFLTDQDMNVLWSDWFNEKLQEADVTVDDRYGFWSPVGIVPPDRPDLAPDQG